LTVCAICNDPCDGAHKCSACNSVVHAICGATDGDGDEGYGKTVLCFLCQAEKTITSERAVAASSMEDQATKTKSSSEKVLTDVDMGTNVLIPIPSVDRGKSDPKNLKVTNLVREKAYYWGNTPETNSTLQTVCLFLLIQWTCRTRFR